VFLVKTALSDGLRQELGSEGLRVFVRVNPGEIYKHDFEDVCAPGRVAT
jgi:NADP-dependent 3-hydroxy acid dehydrogenase YdfG